MTVPAKPRRLASLDDVTQAEWEALASRNVFFGHQSVGRNIMEGVREILAERSNIRLRIVQGPYAASSSDAVFIDANIGENRRPETKAQAFAKAVENGLGPGALAMYKYCYVDVGDQTDIQALFEAYVAQTRRLERAHPDTTIVHITVPLTTAPGGIKENVKILLGRRTETALNAKRHLFNELLRKEYGGRAPIFDLAHLESMRPDGSPASSKFRSKEVPMLAPEWTFDNGHLNESGRRYIAEQFLVTLARAAALKPVAEAS